MSETQPINGKGIQLVRVGDTGVPGFKAIELALRCGDIGVSAMCIDREENIENATLIVRTFVDNFMESLAKDAAQLADRDSKLAASEEVLRSQMRLKEEYADLMRRYGSRTTSAEESLEQANSQLAALVEALQMVLRNYHVPPIFHDQQPDGSFVLKDLNPLLADTATLARERDERLQRDGAEKALRDAAQMMHPESWKYEDNGASIRLEQVAGWLRARADALTSTGEKQ